MYMSQQELHELESNIKDLNEMVQLGNAMDRLRKNRDFKKVIEVEYLKEEAVRLVHLKADPNMQDERGQARVLRDLDAIGSFTQYIDLVTAKAEAAKEALDECEDLRAELEGASE
jgi:hypothetical protein